MSIYNQLYQHSLRPLTLKKFLLSSHVYLPSLFDIWNIFWIALILDAFCMLESYAWLTELYQTFTCDISLNSLLIHWRRWHAELVTLLLTLFGRFPPSNLLELFSKERKNAEKNALWKGKGIKAYLEELQISQQLYNNKEEEIRWRFPELDI